MKCLNCNEITSNPKFCGKSCAAKYNNKIYKVKEKPKCLHCQSELQRGRKYCSNKCQGALVKKGIRDKILAREWVDARHLKSYLIELSGPVCSECNWSKKNPVTNKVPIEIDHIDGNASNNVLENVRLLCPNCQALTPTYKALNIGNGRHYRRQRYKEGKSY